MFMVSDKTYRELLKREQDAEKNKSLIRNYIDDKKEPKTTFELLVDFDKELKESMGIPTGGSVKDKRGKEKSVITTRSKDTPVVDMKKSPSYNITQITKQASFLLNDILRGNGLTREKIANLTLPEYQKMCKKLCGKGAEVPTQEMLDRFKKFTSELTITDVNMMKYAARSSLVPEFPFKNITESEVLMAVTKGRPVTEELKKYTEKNIKSYNQAISDVGMATALKVMIGITSYGLLPLMELAQNLTNRASNDLPSRKLNVKKDVAPVTATFNQKVNEFKGIKQETKVERKPEVKKEAKAPQRVAPQIEKDVSIGVAHEMPPIETRAKKSETKDLVPIKFNSTKEFMQDIMTNGLNKDAIIDFDNLTVFRKPLEAFDEIDKDTNAPIRTFSAPALDLENAR